MVCVCTECQTVCNVATSDAYRAPRRHVWRVGFPSAPLTVCGVARSDCCSVVQFCDCSSAKLTVAMLSTLLFRMSVSPKNCIIHRRRACLYMLSTTEGARRSMQVWKADIVNNTKATQVSPYDVIDVWKASRERADSAIGRAVSRCVVTQTNVSTCAWHPRVTGIHWEHNIISYRSRRDTIASLPKRDSCPSNFESS